MNYHQSRAENVILDLTSYPEVLRKIGKFDAKVKEHSDAKAEFDKYQNIYRSLDEKWALEKCSKSR